MIKKDLKMSYAPKKSFEDTTKTFSPYNALAANINCKLNLNTLKILQAFLTPYGRIRSRKETNLPKAKYNSIIKLIRKARSNILIQH
jgi:ribosomal protein S18